MRMRKFLALILTALLLLTGCVEVTVIPTAPSVSLDAIPAWSGDAYVQIDRGIPGFTAEDLTAKAFEQYSPWTPWAAAVLPTPACPGN